MTNNLQALYDILGEAFKAGSAYTKDETQFSSRWLFPLAARMEEEITRIVKYTVASCIVSAEEVAMDLYRDGEIEKSFGADAVAEYLRSLPSSPERET